jgi:DNA gyrase/topoisomerase IV subunit A
MNKGVSRCTGRNLSRETTEQIVLTTLADKVFTPTRVEIMLRELRKRQRAARTTEDARLQELTRELKEIDAGIARLYEAVEKGILPLDTTLQERSQKLQARPASRSERASGAAQQVGRVGQPPHPGAHRKIRPHVESEAAGYRVRIRQGILEFAGR